MIKRLVLFISIFIFGITTVNAAPGANDVIEMNGTYYTKISTALNTLDPENCPTTTITLIKDVQENFTIKTGHDIILDLNGYTITNNGEKTVITNNGTLEIKNGTVTSSAASGMINNNSKGVLTVTSGNLLATGKRQAIYNDGGTLYISDTAYIESASDERAAIQNRNNGKVYINGGTLIATDGVGIYFPQRDSVAIINGGNISGPTGIEIRASKLIVNDGVITGTHDTFEFVANASGTTTKGAAIAISQHTTQLPIEVIINGGNLKAPSPLTEINPMNNPQEAIDKISISISQGNFESSGSESIDTEDNIPIISFITGGTYTTDPSRYVKDGYVVIKIDDNKYKVIDPNSLIINPTNNEMQQNSQSSTNNSVENNAENIINEIDKEKQTSNPKTEDNIIFFVGLFDVSIVSLAFLLYKNRRKLIK